MEPDTSIPRIHQGEIWLGLIPRDQLASDSPTKVILVALSQGNYTGSAAPNPKQPAAVCKMRVLLKSGNVRDVSFLDLFCTVSKEFWRCSVNSNDLVDLVGVFRGKAIL